MSFIKNEKENILDTICNNKLIEVVLAKQNIRESELLDKCREVERPRGFINSLRHKHNRGEIGLIAEVKKASPSKGVIREDFNHIEIAKSYEKSGATCLSVLTDKEFFQGKDEYLTEISNNVSLPIIRKDFIIDPYQVVESRAIGADCILLIMSILSDEQAIELEAAALSLGMDVLVEVHDLNELSRALSNLKASMIGVNNRNLKTLEINRYTIGGLARHIPDDRIIICESGIRNNDDIKLVQKLGVNCFLVGENLMKNDNIEKATRDLLNNKVDA